MPLIFTTKIKSFYLIIFHPKNKYYIFAFVKNSGY